MEAKLRDWHRWFAWYPVETQDRGRVWFRVVWRSWGGDDWPSWWYRVGGPVSAYKGEL